MVDLTKGIWENPGSKTATDRYLRVLFPKNPYKHQQQPGFKGILQKAAPRFELGIKDLQSSALPLGHAAIQGALTPLADRISESSGSLLFISNGHGEDLIALKIIEALRNQRPQLILKVLPLVGTGGSFQSAVEKGWVQRVGPSAPLPSGGFSNQSLRGLLADVIAGLPLLTWQQWRCLRKQRAEVDAVLAVGDLLPLLLAWGSGRPFGFVGTPKSDYTWCSGPGRDLSDNYHALKGSEWDPWEWLLMRNKRCRLVVTRDRLTARGLRRHGVRAEALGNPMMDGLSDATAPTSLTRCRRILLLCGSRMPEAERNFSRLLLCLAPLPNDRPIAVLVALGSTPGLQALGSELKRQGFRSSPPPSDALHAGACWLKGHVLVLLGTGQFELWAPWAEVGVATAGTATEQLVGLGIPALSLPGKGPQFTQGFAKRQSRLLGGAVRSCQSIHELNTRLKQLLEDPSLRLQMGRIGRERMGPAGGSEAIAKRVLIQLPLGHGY